MRSLTTQRLLLRPFTREDEAIHRLVYADPEVAYPFCGTTRTLRGGPRLAGPPRLAGGGGRSG
jgi:hypothetical protein